MGRANKANAEKAAAKRAQQAAKETQTKQNESHHRPPVRTVENFVHITNVTESSPNVFDVIGIVRYARRQRPLGEIEAVGDQGLSAKAAGAAGVNGNQLRGNISVDGTKPRPLYIVVQIYPSNGPTSVRLVN